jgi:DNA-binding MarR family transcriptional regulator
VARVTDPTDRRSSILTVTGDGRGLLRRLRARKTAYLAQRLQDLPEDDVAALARAADVLERMLEDHPTAELRARTGGGTW